MRSVNLRTDAEQLVGQFSVLVTDLGIYAGIVQEVTTEAILLRDGWRYDEGGVGLAEGRLVQLSLSMVSVNGFFEQGPTNLNAFCELCYEAETNRPKYETVLPEIKLDDENPDLSLLVKVLKPWAGAK